MTFYDRYVGLCEEHGFKPQSPEMQEVTGVSSPAISGWKKGSIPKGEVICNLATYFHVTSDYLLGLSELRNPGETLSEQEQILLTAFRAADTMGRMNIIYVCMDEQKKAELKKGTVNAG